MHRRLPLLLVVLGLALVVIGPIEPTVGVWSESQDDGSGREHFVSVSALAGVLTVVVGMLLAVVSRLRRRRAARSV